jgi:glycosyltransferase involved in cell wall biosynthesis
MARLSAVVLTYNKGWILDTFLNSLDSQTRRPDEVVIVDDASTDGTIDRLKALSKDWMVAILPTNQGQSEARNRGFALASGEYLIFLDSDIEMRPGMLEIMARVLDSDPTVSIVYGHYQRTGSRTDALRAIPWDPEFLKRGNYISTMSMVRRADLPDPPFDPALRRYEDWDLWLRMARQGLRGALVDRVLFTAHYRPGDLSGTGESLPWYERVLRKHGLSA